MKRWVDVGLSHGEDITARSSLVKFKIGSLQWSRSWKFTEKSQSVISWSQQEARLGSWDQEKGKCLLWFWASWSSVNQEHKVEKQSCTGRQVEVVWRDFLNTGGGVVSTHSHQLVVGVQSAMLRTILRSSLVCAWKGATNNSLCLPRMPRLGGVVSLCAMWLPSVAELMKRRLAAGLQDVAVDGSLGSNKVG